MSAIVIIFKIPGTQERLKGRFGFFWNSLEGAVVTSQVRVWGREECQLNIN